MTEEAIVMPGAKVVREWIGADNSPVHEVGGPRRSMAKLGR